MFISSFDQTRGRKSLSDGYGHRLRVGSRKAPWRNIALKPLNQFILERLPVRIIIFTRIRGRGTLRSRQRTDHFRGDRDGLRFADDDGEIGSGMKSDGGHLQ